MSLPIGLQRRVRDPGQESVWDYPRPPRIEASSKHVQVAFGGMAVADTRRALRVLETSHPPVYYIPPEDVRVDCLADSPRHSWCEWKGEATYYHLVTQDRTLEDAAWTYLDPLPPFAVLRGHLAFYPSRADACYVDGEAVQSQPGDFYGGWITRDIVGPFKGPLGTSGW